MTEEFPYEEDKVRVKTLNKILRVWERALEHSSLFCDLSACQLWYACESLPWTRPVSVDRLSFFQELLGCGLHLSALLDKLAKYTYSPHRLNRICQALLALYLRQYPIPNHSFLRSDILTLPEFRRRSDRSRLIFECPDAIYLDVSEAFSFAHLLVIRSEASFEYENRAAEGC